MVEVPSAALLADEILGSCAFVSIGTNDLAQYALAADRQLGGLAALQDPWHPALLRLVAMVGEAGSGPASRSVCAARPRPTRCSPACWWGSGATSLSMAALGTGRRAGRARRADGGGVPGDGAPGAGY